MAPLTLTGDPERDDWPSVEDPEPLCRYCERIVGEESHHPTCPDYTPSFDELMFCPACGVEFFTACACDGHECDEEGDR